MVTVIADGKTSRFAIACYYLFILEGREIVTSTA
jgi:hypothetical protein